MKRLLALSVFIVCLGVFLFAQIPISYSDELDDINKQLNDLNKALSMSKAATAPLESQLTSMKTQITQIKQSVAGIEVSIAEKKKNIDQGYQSLAKQEDVLHKAIRDFYVKSYYNSPLTMFLSATSASDIAQLLAYQKAATNQDKAIITNIAISIQDLEEKKQSLESEQTRLTAIKANLDQQSADLDKIVQGAKAYQANLSSQIAVLSAKQQQILSQRLSSLNIPLYAYTTQGGCSSDLTNGKDPGFGGGFGFFTYGVPNRVGLNQYGAKGRAEAGQNAQTILTAYYNADYTTGYNQSINIHVTGTNEYGQSFDDNWSIEEYLKHVYEVPTNWPMESLKAQAIAARSYALSRTNNGATEICPSQHCQVVKREENSDAWKQAVSETAGIVLTSGGSPITAWFSSTHGGYVFASGGDIGGAAWTKNAKDTTTDAITSFSDLQNSAYDKASPWFYCDWGSRSSNGGTAWLKPEEVADIVNTLILVKQDDGTKEHLYQTDKANPAGTDTWDEERVKQELGNRGQTAFNSISSISIDWDKGAGKTNSITFSGDNGSVNFSAEDFKNRFNLRAPANIQIVGPLYNAEKR